MQQSSKLTTLLFTDIEGSTRLWEQEAASMSLALAEHDRLSRAAVAGHRGVIVKMTGDGMYAAFAEPADALAATVALQRSLDALREGGAGGATRARGAAPRDLSSVATRTSSAVRSTAPPGS